ncbi:PKD domain-containing protein [Actinoplanes bogorensis]|uniref:PKD domain-containing protein n=1 Tax=Paractinoplanes bogorensis TaxID=1610840 RepID=A0ABS5YKC3_9ACTN|nr:PKD domain-containing protein [Actinoplanes bogorensis]MBU2663138.1 PKD domain-containing protein [Actinoplanes bogorensis]
MKIVYRRALPALFTAALTAGVVGVGAPALAAGEAPTGTFALNGTAVWAGQTVTLTQTALADDDIPVEEISRVITWGDGTAAQTAEAGSTSWTHTYAANGTFTVSVALNDGTVAGTGTLASAAVSVTTPSGSLGWQKSTIYTNTYTSGGSTYDYLVEGVFAPSGMPATADEAWTEWGDGEYTLLKQDATATTVPHYFDQGTFTPKVQFSNEHGKATARNASTLNVLYDKTAPKVAIKYPSPPNKASLWSTIRGTASDSQSGMDYVSLIVLKWNNASGTYMYNFDAKSWIKYTGQPLSSMPSGIEDTPSVASNGTWASRPVTGLAKGWHLEIWPVALDKVANYSNPEYYVPVWLAS